jgi:putative RecB family exonuclease
MALYSHSKLSTFEQCKLKYKFRYIDKIKPDFEKTIESHLGTCVHDTLEWLYSEVLRGRIPNLDQIILKYQENWDKDPNKKFSIAQFGMKEENYFEKGVKFLIDYYLKHQPFNDGTIALEKQIYVELHPEFPHKITGFIDRLVYNKKTGEYEIHDYKTANTLPDKEKIETDRQLALYSIAIKQKYETDKPILLTWHYLNHNIQIFSRRTNEQLEELKKDIINLINEIEQTKEFSANVSKLCNWCEYNQSCPKFSKK